MTAPSPLQISDGYGGDAAPRAAAIFQGTYLCKYILRYSLETPPDPLNGSDLSRLPYDIYDNLALMREAIEDADQQSYVLELSRYEHESEQGS